MGMKTELLSFSMHKAHVGKDLGALAAADIEAHSVPVLSFLQTEDLNLKTSWPGTLCELQDSSWNCTALITKVLLHQDQSVAVRWVNYVEERRQGSSKKLQQVQNCS